MGSKARKRVHDEGNRPSTFFIVAIVAALVMLVVAFVSYVSTTPGARPPTSTTTSAQAGQLPISS